MVEPLLIIVTGLWAAAISCHFGGWLISHICECYNEVGYFLTVYIQFIYW